MTDFVEATATHRFAASAERVFDAWLTPTLVRAWMAQPVGGGQGFDVRRIEIDARVGGKFVFSDMREGGEAIHWGYYLQIDRPHRLEFSWFTSEEEEREGTSVVTLTITPAGEGCEATIVHRMDARLTEWVGKTQNGWHMMLSKVDSVLKSPA
ncbi:SRPBCC family protein [Mycolicibacterium lutetiense]